MVLFGFQFYPVCSVGKFINFSLSTVRGERVNHRGSMAPVEVGRGWGGGGWGEGVVIR